MSGIPSHLELGSTVTGTGRRLGWVILPPGLGMSGSAESLLEAGERPTYRDGWGPRQAAPIRQDGVPVQSYKYLGC